MKRLIFLLIIFSFFLPIGAPLYAIGTQGVLSGRIIDQDSGKGIAHVFVSAKSSSDTFTGTTDENGYFSIASVPSGEYTLSIERVGYVAATYAGIIVTGDASTSLQLPLMPSAVEVPGITITGRRAPIANPHQSFVDYSYSTQEIKQVLPAVASNNMLAILESQPGVGIGYDAFFGQAFPHVRGGTGFDIGFAFDGIPTYEPITDLFATNLSYVGTGRTDFYVGGYPAPYGNSLSGFVNQIVPRGSGPIHGSIQYETGFTVDAGARLPSYNPATGLSPTYNGAPYYGPTNINIELQGKDRKFGYYFNHLIQDGGAYQQYNGVIPYPSGVDIKPYINETGALVSNYQLRDTVLNLTYDLNPFNDLQFLAAEGIQKGNLAGFQELPCNPTTEGAACVGNNTATGFGESFNANVIAPVPDDTTNTSYDLEKLEWSHRFLSPGKVINFRLWEYNPTFVSTSFAMPSTFWMYRKSAEKGALIEYQNQLTPEHLLDVGTNYVYSNNYLLSDSSNVLAPAGGTIFSSGQDFLFPPGTIRNLHTASAPDTQTKSAWLTDEWRPTPKWEFYGGLRYDSQAYLIFPGLNATPFAVNVPGYVNGTPIDRGFANPSMISPRIGASYQLSDKLTMKASYGKFVNFAPARRTEALLGSQDSLLNYIYQGVSTFTPGFSPPTGTVTVPNGPTCADANGCYQFPAGTAEWLAGSKPQTGENFDVSWEYQLDDNTLFKVTPYLKHIKDPIESLVVNGIPEFTNAGVISSKGIEFYLKSRDWHNLSGFISYTYSVTNGSQLPFQADLQSAAPFLCTPALGCSSSGPFSNAAATASANQMVPVPYDQRHFINAAVDYKVGKWEIAPNIQFGSGFPYGLGTANLQALAALMDPASFLYGGAHTVAQSVAAVGFTNPLNESGFDSLRHPAWWLGNIAVTYHINSNLSAILNVFNLFNSNQVLTTDNGVLGGVGYNELTNPQAAHGLAGVPCCYTSLDASKNILPQYSPLSGQYAPFGYPTLRQFFLTLRYTY